MIMNEQQENLRAKLEHDLRNVLMLVTCQQFDLNAIKNRLELCYKTCKDIELNRDMNSKTQVIDLNELQ